MNDWITEEIKAQYRELNAILPMGHKLARGGPIKEENDDEKRKTLRIVADNTHYIRDRKPR